MIKVFSAGSRSQACRRDQARANKMATHYCLVVFFADYAKAIHMPCLESWKLQCDSHFRVYNRQQSNRPWCGIIYNKNKKIAGLRHLALWIADPVFMHSAWYVGDMVIWQQITIKLSGKLWKRILFLQSLFDKIEGIPLTLLLSKMFELLNDLLHF